LFYIFRYAILNVLSLPHRREVNNVADFFLSLFVGILAGIIANLLTDFIRHKRH